MSFEPYTVKSKTPEERGHRPDCSFTNNFGPSCDCDGIRNDAHRLQVTELMRGTGWEVDSRTEALAFYRRMGPHIITVCKCVSGWQYKWERGPIMTLEENSGFGTIDACLSDFWESIAVRQDAYYQTQCDLYAYRKACMFLAADDVAEKYEVPP